VLGGKKSAPKLGNARIVPNEEGARSASGRADAPDPCAVGFEGDDEAFRDDRAINPAGCVFPKVRWNWVEPKASAAIELGPQTFADREGSDERAIPFGRRNGPACLKQLPVRRKKPPCSVRKTSLLILLK
jgi:hypothetical protein